MPWFSDCEVEEVIKNILNCCKLQIVLKYKTRLDKNFLHIKDRIPKDLTSVVVVIYKFQCGLCSKSCYSECVRHCITLFSYFCIIILYNIIFISSLNNVNNNIGDILVYHHLPKNKLSLSAAPQLIIFYFGTI